MFSPWYTVLYPIPIPPRVSWMGGDVGCAENKIVGLINFNFFSVGKWTCIREMRSILPITPIAPKRIYADAE